METRGESTCDDRGGGGRCGDRVMARGEAHTLVRSWAGVPRPSRSISRLRADGVRAGDWVIDARDGDLVIDARDGVFSGFGGGIAIEILPSSGTVLGTMPVNFSFAVRTKERDSPASLGASTGDSRSAGSGGISSGN